MLAAYGAGVAFLVNAVTFLLVLGARLEALAEGAAALGEDELGNLALRLAILSSRHETQYSRLFRS